MSAHHLASCENCWFNSLQNGSIGLSVGYCVEHRRVLLDSSATTCNKHFRKDLSLPRAEKFHENHEKSLPSSKIVLVAAIEAKEDENGRALDEASALISDDIPYIKRDDVGDLVADYGLEDKKIATLSVLRRGPHSRMEFAILNLSRSYVHRCKLRGGAWTSGLNIFWWIKNGLTTMPEFSPSDFRYSTAGSLDRQDDIAKWWLMMMRLVFISDVAYHADRAADYLDSLKTLPQDAALATETVSSKKLHAWIKKVGVRRLEEAMPKERYQSLMEPLIRDD